MEPQLKNYLDYYLEDNINLKHLLFLFYHLNILNNRLYLGSDENLNISGMLGLTHEKSTALLIEWVYLNLSKKVI